MIETPTPIHTVPVTGIGEIQPGDRLEQALLPALRAAGVETGDVLCISTKIVSKSLGLVTSPELRDRAVEESSVRIVARRLHTHRVTTIAQIPSGPVMAAAGVDSSNAPGGPLLLPPDPDACAAELRTALQDALGLRLAVVLTDTSSRVWRVGVGDIALGAAGLRSLQDLRGSVDGSGRSLSVTVRNLADEIAAAADLVKGKSERVPLALVRGLAEHVVDGDAQVPAAALSRTGGEDWFRRPSLESVWQAMGVPADREPIARMSPEPADERIARALAVALIDRIEAPPTDEDAPAPQGQVPGSPTARARLVGPRRIEVHPAGDGPQHWLAAGALAERIRTALGAEAIAAPLPDVQIHITPETAP